MKQVHSTQTKTGETNTFSHFQQLFLNLSTLDLTSSKKCKNYIKAVIKYLRQVSPNVQLGNVRAVDLLAALQFFTCEDIAVEFLLTELADITLN